MSFTSTSFFECKSQIEQSYSNDPTKPKLTTVGVIRKVTRDSGVRGLFRGLNMTLIREVPGTSIWFVAYEMALRPFIRHGYSRNSIPMKGVITAGAIRYLFWRLFPVVAPRTGAWCIPSTQSSQSYRLTHFIAVR